MNIGLTFDLNEVLDYLSPILDRLIEHDVEPTNLWYAFAEFMALYCNRRIHYLGLPHVEDNVLMELQEVYFGISIGVEVIRLALEGLAHRHLNTVDLIIADMSAHHQTLRTVDGLWQEPMLYHHPMLIFCSQDRPHRSTLPVVVSKR